jgi:16S rRNA (guanine966-N2)-methyltransferase
VRIIAGRWRSRRLVAPAGNLTRPTSDRTRETLFSMLTSRLGGFEALAVLDLFAGSGAFAFEALSRGAARAILVERDPAARAAIAANIAALGANARLFAVDATSLPPAEWQADLLFLDPPYGQGLVEPALASARATGWIADHAWIAAETAAHEMLVPAGFSVEADRRVGKARLTLLRPAA